MFGWLKRLFPHSRPREEISAQWRQWIEPVFLFKTLDEEDQHRAFGIAREMVRQTQFEGCGGFEMTERVEAVIAIQAAVLVLGHWKDKYHSPDEILVYPTAFLTGEVREDEKGSFVDGDTVLHGEAWGTGQVILSWDVVAAESFDRKPISSVVLHEFAHRVDQASGVADGFPVMPRGVSTARWQTVMQGVYAAHVDAVEKEQDSFFDPYGATNEAEFFAVVTEAFFLRGDELSVAHHELYGLLRDFYRQDPAARLDGYKPAVEDGMPKAEEARDVVVDYDLEPHPEGGWYRETHRSPVMLPKSALPRGYDGDRCAVTSILFLLVTGQRSKRHRVRSEEIWLHQLGDDLELVYDDEHGAPVTVRLGHEEGAVPQAVVPAGAWQHAEALKGEFGYVLVGCVVAPGFDFADFEI